jgi:gliding motility-associated-like protein
MHPNKKYALLISFLMIFFGLHLFAQNIALTVNPANTNICVPGSATLVATPPASFPGDTVSLSDDQYSRVVNIGFPFTFFGNTYTQCIISSNNYISFNTQYAGIGSPWTITYAIPSIYSPKNTIMCPWQDIDPSIAGTITYATLGTAPNRVFVIAFCSTTMFWCHDLNFTSQIQLYEGSNRIETHIASKPICPGWNGGQAIHGIHNSLGTIAYVVPGRNAGTQWTTSNEGYQFTPTGLQTFSQGFIPYKPVILSATTGPVSWYIDTVLVGTGDTLKVSPTTTTTYTATISGGCIGNSSAKATVTVNSNIAQAGPNDTICSGKSIVLHGSANGGTPPLTYTWTPAATLTGANTANPTASPASTTNYVLSIRDSSGCLSHDTVSVLVPSPLVLNMFSNPASCSGVATAQAKVTTAGGYPPYSFSWSPGIGSASSVYPNLGPGTYTVNVTDHAGCGGNGTVTITQPVILTATSGSQTPHCATTDGKCWAIPSGGTPPFTYSWNTVPSQNTDTAFHVGSGTYCLTLKDAGGCVDTICITVLNASGLTAAITAFSNPKCNSSCDGSATGLQIGGSAPFAYLWNTSPSQTTASANALCAGTHILKITDANGCSDTASITLTQPQPLIVTASVPATLCIGQSASLTASASGGVPAYTFNWSPPAFSGSTLTVSPSQTSTYTLTVTDAHACSGIQQTITVAVNPPLEVTVSGAADSLCIGTSTTLSASGTGGDNQFSYIWLPGHLSGSSITVSPAASATYTAIVHDNCNTPTDSALLLVRVFPLPPVSFSASDTLGCAGLCTVFTNTSSGTLSSSWTFGDGFTGGPSGTVRHCYPNAGSYTVGLSIQDIHGCRNTSSQANLIHVSAGPEADFSFSPQPASILNPVIYFQDQSTNAVSWQWNFGFSDSSSVRQNPSFSYSDTGQYLVSLIVSNSAGCTDTLIKPIRIKPDFAIYVPNAFTPNDDGLNDIFLPRGMGIEGSTYELYVFDRWGNALFHSQDLAKGWDGRVNGGTDIAQIDTYVWQITFRDMNESYHHYVGHLSLLK